MKKLLSILLLGISMTNLFGIDVYFVNQSKRLPAKFRVFGKKDPIVVDAGTYRKVDVTAENLKNVSVEGSFLRDLTPKGFGTQSRIQYEKLESLPASGEILAYQATFYEPPHVSGEVGERFLGHSGHSITRGPLKEHELMRILKVQPMAVD